MSARRKTWKEKLHSGERKLVSIPERWRKRFPGATMLIAKPLDIDALVRSVPKGRLITQTALRERLARDHGADVTCPLTTGIFLRIVAEAAEEARAEGEANIAPWWRVVKDDGSLNEKMPGGAQAQAERLAGEGRGLTPGRGKKPPRVNDLESALFSLT